MKIHDFFDKCRWFNIQLTTAFDITTTIHWSVPAFLLIMLFFNPFFSLVFAITLLCVIPHEYGHALAAKYYGIKTAGIVIYPLGGLALLVENKTIKIEGVKELVIAAAGPIVNLFLATISLLMISEWKINFWTLFFGINTILFLFNFLIPAFPLDGGRILRAVLSLFMNRLHSTQCAYYCSIFLCVLFGVYAIFDLNVFLMLTIIAIYFLARIEYNQVRQLEQG